MDLKDYIFHLKELEISCYKQQRYINLLQQKVKYTQNFRKQALEDSYTAKSAIKNAVWDANRKFDFNFGEFIAALSAPISFWLFGGLIGFVVDIIKLFISGGKFVNTGFDKGGNIGFAIGLIVAIGTVLFVMRYPIIIIKNFIKYKNDNKIIAVRNAERVKENEYNQQNQRKRVAILEKELSAARRLYSETDSIRKKCYSAGIVYEKYRSLIPICMFYEYLVSGRCQSLEGHEGAYNIYENEIRMNIIITQMDQVIQKLDQIREAQHELSMAVKNCNSELKRLNSSMEYQAKELHDIRDSQEVSSYYEGISAMNTTYLAWSRFLE